MKFTLTEYIKTGDSELLSLMARSLGIDYENTQKLIINQQNGR